MSHVGPTCFACGLYGFQEASAMPVPLVLFAYLFGESFWLSLD